VELYLQSRIRPHGVVLNHRDSFMYSIFAVWRLKDGLMVFNTGQLSNR
jgi:hypothetical protein